MNKKKNLSYNNSNNRKINIEYDTTDDNDGNAGNNKACSPLKTNNSMFFLSNFK